MGKVCKMGQSLLCCCSLLIVSALVRPAWAEDFSAIVAQVKPSVLALGNYQPLRQPAVMFVGTAFVVADGRHVITNAHNIPEFLDPDKKESMVVVVPGDGHKEEVRMATVVKEDDRHDLALLKISDAPLPSLELGDDAVVKEGQEFLLSGFPIGAALGYHVVTHKAMLSAITPAVQPVYNAKQLNPRLLKRMATHYQVFQLDAIAYPGSSGSPLYDPGTGKVIGVINSVFVKDTKEDILENPSGISYAIPVRFVKMLLQEAGLYAKNDAKQ
jgi:serine protease Do